VQGSLSSFIVDVYILLVLIKIKEKLMLEFLYFILNITSRAFIARPFLFSPNE